MLVFYVVIIMENKIIDNLQKEEPMKEERMEKEQKTKAQRMTKQARTCLHC